MITNFNQFSVSKGDGLLHSTVCHILLVSQVLLLKSKEMEVIGPHIAKQTCDWEVMDHPPHSPNLTSPSI